MDHAKDHAKDHAEAIKRLHAEYDRIQSRIQAMYVDSQESMEKRRLLNFAVSNSEWANGELNATLREPFGFIAEMPTYTSGGGSSNGANVADHSNWLGN